MSTFTMETHAGEHIRAAADRAVKMCRQKSCEVTFDFNGIKLIATPVATAASLIAKYDAECRRVSDEYRASAKGIEEEKKRAAEIVERNDSIKSLCSALPGLREEKTHNAAWLNRMMAWLRSFAENADDIGIDWSNVAPVENGKEWVMLQLQAAGFRDNEHVGEAPEWFNTRERVGRYVMGQAINCLKNGMPPHPITLSFVEKYFALP